MRSAATSAASDCKGQTKTDRSDIDDDNGDEEGAAQMIVHDSYSQRRWLDLMVGRVMHSQGSTDLNIGIS